MIRKTLILFSSLIFLSCNTNYDYSFPEVFTKQLHHYAVNDTIYFKSNRNDLDTIAITGRFSDISEGSALYPPQNDMALMINDLPLAEGKKNYERKHALVILKKYSRDSYLYIRYRNFMEMMKPEDIQGKDTIILKLTDPRKASKPEDIVEVRWALSQGLLGYTNLRGDRYAIQLEVPTNY